jgi:tetratricopeptide (TPR) repeat protein
VDMPKASKKQTLIPFLGGLILALLLCGVPLLWFLSTARFQEAVKPFAYAAQTAALPPVTETVGWDPGDLATATVDISSLPYSKRFELAGPDISEALEHLYDHESAEEVMAWDKVLQIIPEYAEAHYRRGDAYLKLLENQRSQDEYLYYLSLAGADFDKAIELKPYDKGDYYLGRFKYYDHLSGMQTYRINRMQLAQTALDNLQMANRLGNYDPLAERYVIFTNIVLGNCDAGIDQANRLIAEAAEPVGALYTGLALGHACKNEPEKALAFIDEAIQLKDTCLNRFERAKILYEVGRNEDAIAELDYSISKDPYYCGERYYLRSLLYAESGDLQKAEDDLLFGMGQTWGRGGLLSYAQGKIALAQADEESAIQYFQDAERTYQLIDPIYVKIRDDLDALGGSPLEVDSSFAFATAIPTPTAFPTARPTSSPDPSLPTPAFEMDPSLQGAIIVDPEKPIEPVKIGWGFSALWRFQPAQPLDHREVQRLSIWLISSDTSQRLPRQISLWNFRWNMWGGNNELHWGENRINAANEFVSADGDVYIRLASDDDTLETVIDTFGITLVLQRTDGTVEVHGITP